MKIVVTGSSGLVGSALASSLSDGGHEVVRVTRGIAGPEYEVYHWDPDKGSVDSHAFAGSDAVVHLAGENIAAHRWTPAQKERIRDSRIQGTRTISQALANLEHPPKTFICASAVGFYGDREDVTLDEESPAGKGFLPDVCQAWERETKAAADKGVRVVCLRIGVVLSPNGGALAKMLKPFKWGAGGVVGNGRQYMSWIDLEDLVGIIEYALQSENLRGPVNAVAPEPVTNREFTKTLGHVLNRPTFLPLPTFAAHAAFGQMADELLLASARVVPRRLQDKGYQFKYPHLEEALHHQLGR